MNTFYHGDCLFVMNHDIEPNSIDLIYLDPPFFTGKVQKGKTKKASEWLPAAMPIDYNDSKKFWGDTKLCEEARTQSPMWLQDIATTRPDFASYLWYMMQRLQACHNVLKPTGSIYLHCDWRASHYLKMIMDKIFGHGNFRNEIIWWYHDPAGTVKDRFKKKHDTIFFYAKTLAKERTFNMDAVRQPYSKGTQQQAAHGVISFGRPTKTHLLGKVPEDVWEIPFINSQAKERLGYPTQKPEALLKRIIEASSNKDDIVLDPFCGCGTTIAVAYQLGRKWIGIDESYNAYLVSKGRYHQLELQTTFGLPEPSYVERTLTDVDAITDTTEFEKWVNEYFKATKPYPDKGVDGIIQDGTPIQTKTNEIKETILHQFIHQATSHPKVPQPVKRVIAVSKIGFDDNSRQLKFTTGTKEGIKVDLLTPDMMLEGDGIR